MKKLLLVAVAFAAFAVGYGVVAKAYPSPAPYGRAAYHGYFTNTYDDEGTFVLPKVYDGSTHAIPNSALSTEAFISFIESQIGGSNQKTAGASFIIQTMIGSSRNKPPTAGERAQWEDLVRGYAAAGRIQWNVNYCFNLNTYYQGTAGGGPDPADDAFYSDSDCKPVILFTDPNGSTYAIKHECANPVGNGSLNPLHPARNWSMSGRTDVSILNPLPGQTNPAPGQTVQFKHYVKDNGPTDTGQDIWYAPYSYNATTGANTALFGGQDSGAYAAGQEKQVTAPTDTVTIPIGTPGGTQICQRILYDWANSSGGRNGMGAPKCVTVLDVSPGNCTINVPTDLDPTDTFTITGSVMYPGGLLAAQAVDSADSASVQITGPGMNYSNNNAPTTDTTNGSAGVITTTLNNLGPTNNAGHYTVTYAIVGPIGAKSCSVGFDVRYSPYFSVMEGDVSAGPGFGDGGACTPELSGIIGNNRGPGDSYYGSGSQLAAFALNNVTGFATDANRNNGLGTATSSAGGSVALPSGLAFSNAGTSPATQAGPWGTSFGRTPANNANSCVPDYYKDATTATPGPTTLSNTNYFLDQNAINGLTSGKTYVINGNLQTGDTGGAGGWLYFGGGSPSRITIVVNGDAWINSHIGYRPYNYVSGTTSVNSIPQFQLIVKGNIYIDRGVTYLAGFYAAQPTGANKGMIYTCSTGQNYIGKYLTDDTTDSSPNAQQDGTNYYSHCSNQLTVAGSVAAKGIVLNRTHGHRKNTAGAPNDPAELFVYTPDLWMGSQSVTTGGTQPFDAITSLPPIL